jgi:hypothetical protein
MRVVLWVLAGAVTGAVLTFGIVLLILTYGGISQREGGAAMGVIFVMTPAGAVSGAIVGLMVGLLRRKR